MTPKIKNFSTTISSEKTVSEIMKMLRKFGCKRIIQQYDEDDGVLIEFMKEGGNGTVSFRVQPDVARVQKMLIATKKTWQAKEKVRNNPEQAERIAWRLWKDWLHSNLSLIEIDLIPIECALLAYVVNPENGKTMHEMIEIGGLPVLLTSGGNNAHV
jgi:hypothetical protein